MVVQVGCLEGHPSGQGEEKPLAPAPVPVPSQERVALAVEGGDLAVAFQRADLDRESHVYLLVWIVRGYGPRPPRGAVSHPVKRRSCAVQLCVASLVTSL